MKNKKITALLAGTTITASMLTSCGVYGAPEPLVPDTATEEVTEENSEPDEIIQEEDTSEQSSEDFMVIDDGVYLYGPPESLDSKRGE